MQLYKYLMVTVILLSPMAVMAQTKLDCVARYEDSIKKYEIAISQLEQENAEKGGSLEGLLAKDRGFLGQLLAAKNLLVAFTIYPKHGAVADPNERDYYFDVQRVINMADIYKKSGELAEFRAALQLTLDQMKSYGAICGSETLDDEHSLGSHFLELFSKNISKN